MGKTFSIEKIGNGSCLLEGDLPTVFVSANKKSLQTAKAWGELVSWDGDCQTRSLGVHGA